MQIVIDSPSPRVQSSDSTSTTPYSQETTIPFTASPAHPTTTISTSFSVSTLLDSTQSFPSNPPSYFDSLLSLSDNSLRQGNSTFPLFYASATSSINPLSFSFPIHRPTPIYTYPAVTNLPVSSIPYLYSSVLSSMASSLSYSTGSFSRGSSISSGPTSGSSRGTALSRSRNWPWSDTYQNLRDWRPRPTTTQTSSLNNTLLFSLPSSWANPPNYPHSGTPLDLTHVSSSSFHTSTRSIFSSPVICSPMITFNEPSNNVKDMFYFIHTFQFSPNDNNKLVLRSLIKR